MESNNIPYIDLCISKESCYEESVDAIVSDLYPDIREIVGVTAKAYVKDVAVQNDRILITGEIKSEVCFLGDTTNEDEQNILKMNVALSFARVEDIDAKECEVFVKGDIFKVNAKIINPRKISVIADINLKTDVYKKTTLETNNVENIEYQMLKMMKKVEIIDTVNRNDFTLNDTLTFQINTKNDYELFGIEPKISISEMKILKNKLMLRGCVDFEAGYVDGEILGNTNASVPFSQICDITITDEDLASKFELSVVDFEVENTSGNDYYYNIKVKSIFVQYKEYEIECIEDLYSTTCDLDILKETVEITSYKPVEVVKNTQNLDLEAQIDNVLYAHCNLYKEKTDEQTIDLFASLMVVYNTNMQCKMYKKDVCIYKNINNNEAQNAKVEILGNNQLKLSYDLNINIISKEKYDKYIEIIETNDKDVEKDCIILKHIDKQVSIWALAKEYNSTDEAIKLANDIDENEQSVANQMIIIPT